LKVKYDIDKFHIEFNHWDKTGSIENLRYGIFWHKTPMVLFRENIKTYNFLLKSLVSNHFKPIIPFCARVLPIVTTWNLVLLCESCGKSRLCFGKTIWNWIFLSETGGKLRLCFGKMIWNRVFLCEIGKKLKLSEIDYLRIMSICRQEMNTNWKISI